MSAYRPAVGDRVRLESWGNGGYLDVDYVGREHFVGVSQFGFQCWKSLALPWVKVSPRPELPDLPEKWAVIHDASYGAHTSVPYWDSARDARNSQDATRATNPYHPADLAFVRYVPDPDSIVWADGLDGGA